MGRILLRTSATAVVAVLLISLMLYVTFFDIKRFRFFKMMFRTDTQIENVEKPVAAPTPAK